MTRKKRVAAREALVPELYSPPSPATSDDVFSALRKRYPPPAWLLLEEVRNKTGYSGGPERFADAIAMSLWPSHGLELHGFEVKVSRNDWLRERKAPEKAETIAAYCDRWWLVVGSADVIRDGELPPAWGLLTLSKRGLVASKDAAKNANVRPMDRRFLASLLRRASGKIETMVHQDDVEKRVKEQVAAEIERKSDASLNARLQARIDELERGRAAICSQLGLRDWDLYPHSLPNVRSALDLVLSLERRSSTIISAHHVIRQLDDAKKQIESAVKIVQDATSIKKE